MRRLVRVLTALIPNMRLWDRLRPNFRLQLLSGSHEPFSLYHQSVLIWLDCFFVMSVLTTTESRGRFSASKMHLSPPPPQWLRLLSVLRQWSCCCWSIVLCTSHCLWEFCGCLCFVMHYFVSTLILQSSWRGRESWLLRYYCLTDV